MSLLVNFLLLFITLLGISTIVESKSDLYNSYPTNYLKKDLFGKVNRDSHAAATGAVSSDINNAGEIPITGGGFDGPGVSYGAPNNNYGVPNDGKSTYHYQLMPNPGYGGSLPNNNYGAPSQSYGVQSGYGQQGGYSGVSQSYGVNSDYDEDGDESGSKDICKSLILPVAKVLGFKALKKIGMIKAFNWGFLLAPFLAPFVLPVLAPILLPLFLVAAVLYLLPIALGGLVILAVLAIPLPVIVKNPGKEFKSEIVAKATESARLMKNILDSEECVEKISCQASIMAQYFNVDKWISKTIDKINFKNGFTLRVSKGLKIPINGGSCETLICNPMSPAIKLVNKENNTNYKTT